MTNITEVSTALADLTTKATTTWMGVAGLVLAIVGFVILIRIIKKIRG